MSESSPLDARDAITNALVNSLGARYPDRLDAAQTEQIRKAVSQLVDLGTTLRTYPLTNADEPDPIFRAFRREE